MKYISSQQSQISVQYMGNFNQMLENERINVYDDHENLLGFLKHQVVTDEKMIDKKVMHQQLSEMETIKSVQQFIDIKYNQTDLQDLVAIRYPATTQLAFDIQAVKDTENTILPVFDGKRIDLIPYQRLQTLRLPQLSYQLSVEVDIHQDNHDDNQHLNTQCEIRLNASTKYLRFMLDTYDISQIMLYRQAPFNEYANEFKHNDNIIQQFSAYLSHDHVLHLKLVFASFVHKDMVFHLDAKLAELFDTAVVVYHNRPVSFMVAVQQNHLILKSEPIDMDLKQLCQYIDAGHLQLDNKYKSTLYQKPILSAHDPSLDVSKIIHIKQTASLLTPIEIDLGFENKDYDKYIVDLLNDFKQYHNTGQQVKHKWWHFWDKPSMIDESDVNNYLHLHQQGIKPHAKKLDHHNTHQGDFHE